MGNRMLNFLKVGYIVLAVASICYSTVQDSSSLIFNDTIVNRFRIDFYITAWHDSLVANKSNNEVYMPARFTWYNPKGDSIVLDSVGVRYKGNSSYAITSEKKPFKVSFNKYRKKQRFFSLEKLNFSNCIQDPSMMREKLAYDILKKYLPVPRSAFATLTVEDTLTNSLFTQVEQVDEPFLKKHYQYEEGNLYKSADQGVSLDYISANKADYETLFELKSDELTDDWSRLINLLEKLKNTPDADFVKTVGNLINLDDCIRYLAFNMVNGNFDSYTGSSRNFYLYDDNKHGKFRFIPWDVNLSFGAYAYSWQSEITTVNAFAPSNIDQRPLEKRILSNDSLKRVYISYMKSMIEGPLSVDSVSFHAHKYATIIDPYVKGDNKKFYTYEQFLRNIDSNIVIQAGPMRTTLLGLKWYTAERNKNVLLQIQNAMPVIRHNSDQTYLESLRIGNEFLGKMQINYTLTSKEYSDVIFDLINAQGKTIISLNEGQKAIGLHSINLNTKVIPAGYYVAVLKAGKFKTSERLLLSK
jgi:hypothetical protein